MGREDAGTHHADLRVRSGSTPEARADEARAIARVAALVVERRDLRARGRPITPLSVADKERVAVIDAELDELWTGLRRTRSSAHRAASPRGTSFT
jgi:hypothetical protein